MRTLFLIASSLFLALFALEDPAAKIKDMDAAHAAAVEKYQKGWLASVDLSDVPLPVLGKDPRLSELALYGEAQTLNRQLLGLRVILLGEAEATKPYAKTGGVNYSKPDVGEWAAIVKRSAELRGTTAKRGP